MVLAGTFGDEGRRGMKGQVSEMKLGFEVHTTRAVGEIRLTRTRTRNALRKRDKQGILDALHEFERDGSVGAVVITSNDPKAFCAGTDIAEMAGLSTEEAVQMFDVEQAMYKAVLESPLPAVTAIEGPALGGGCILACCADLAIAGPGASFAMPEIYLGVPAPLQTALLPQIMGLTRARKMLLLGETYGAEQAFALGLVSELAEDPKARAFEIAAKLAGFSRAGVRSQKRMVNSWISGDYATSVSLSSFVAAAALTEDAAVDGIERFLGRNSASTQTRHEDDSC